MKATDHAVLAAIRKRADRDRLGYNGRAMVSRDPKVEIVEDRQWLLEFIDQEMREKIAMKDAILRASDSFRNVGLSVDADELEESLSVGNHGEPKACTGAEERGISGATGAGQHPDDNSESTGDSADRRSPDGTERTPSPDESNRHFDRGCFVIMELMQAYERRVRSDCTPVEIDKRPWECAEYLKAAEYLRNVWPPHEPPQPAEATECRYCDEVMKERDDYHEWADTLAYDIERLVGVEIGEHSNLNSPWGNAHDAAEYELDKRARKPHEPQAAPLSCVWPDGCRLAGVCEKENCCHGRQQIYASRPKFENVSCSQCGQEFGPGDHGFSHCRNHEHLKPVRWDSLTKGGAHGS